MPSHHRHDPRVRFPTPYGRRARPERRNRCAAYRETRRSAGASRVGTPRRPLAKPTGNQGRARHREPDQGQPRPGPGSRTDHGISPPRSKPLRADASGCPYESVKGNRQPRVYPVRQAGQATSPAYAGPREAIRPPQQSHPSCTKPQALCCGGRARACPDPTSPSFPLQCCRSGNSAENCPSPTCDPYGCPAEPCARRPSRQANAVRSSCSTFQVSLPDRRSRRGSPCTPSVPPPSQSASLPPALSIASKRKIASRPGFCE